MISQDLRKQQVKRITNNFIRRYVSQMFRDTDALIEAMQPKRCHYCKKVCVKHRSIKGKLRPLDTLTRDHMIPKSRGGGKIGRPNLVIACSGCNEEKGALTAPEYMIVLRYRKWVLLKSVLSYYWFMFATVRPFM